MSGQNSVDTFRINRDVTRDNVDITNRQHILNGACIVVQNMYATADFSDTSSSVVHMPFLGNMNINVVSPTNDDVIIVNNPFVNSESFVSVKGPGSSVTTIGTPSVGTVSFNLDTAVNGMYTISISKDVDVLPAESS